MREHHETIYDNRHHDLHFDDDIDSLSSWGSKGSSIRTREELRHSLILRRRRLAQMEEEGNASIDFSLSKDNEGSLVGSLRESLLSFNDSLQGSSLRGSLSKKRETGDKGKKKKKSKKNNKSKKGRKGKRKSRRDVDKAKERDEDGTKKRGGDRKKSPKHRHREKEGGRDTKRPIRRYDEKVGDPKTRATQPNTIDDGEAGGEESSMRAPQNDGSRRQRATSLPEKIMRQNAGAPRQKNTSLPEKMLQDDNCRTASIENVGDRRQTATSLPEKTLRGGNWRATSMRALSLGGKSMRKLKQHFSMSNATGDAERPPNESYGVPCAWDEKTGACINHPDVQLRKRSRFGGWKAVLDSCPECAAEAEKTAPSTARRRRSREDIDGSWRTGVSSRKDVTQAERGTTRNHRSSRSSVRRDGSLVRRDGSLVGRESNRRKAVLHRQSSQSRRGSDSDSSSVSSSSSSSAPSKNEYVPLPLVRGVDIRQVSRGKSGPRSSSQPSFRTRSVRSANTRRSSGDMRDPRSVSQPRLHSHSSSKRSSSIAQKAQSTKSSSPTADAPAIQQPASRGQPRDPPSAGGGNSRGMIQQRSQSLGHQSMNRLKKKVPERSKSYSAPTRGPTSQPISRLQMKSPNHADTTATSKSQHRKDRLRPEPISQPGAKDQEMGRKRPASCEPPSRHCNISTQQAVRNVVDLDQPKSSKTPLSKKLEKQSSRSNSRRWSESNLDESSHIGSESECALFNGRGGKAYNEEGMFSFFREKMQRDSSAVEGEEKKTNSTEQLSTADAVDKRPQSNPSLSLEGMSAKDLMNLVAEKAQSDKSLRNMADLERALMEAQLNINSGGAIDGNAEESKLSVLREAVKSYINAETPTADQPTVQGKVPLVESDTQKSAGEPKRERPGFYKLGDKGRKRDMIKNTDGDAALKRIGSLRPDDHAWIQRSDGNWTYAKVKHVASDTIVFIVNQSGSRVKEYNVRYWVRYIRMLKAPPVLPSKDTNDDGMRSATAGKLQQKLLHKDPRGAGDADSYFNSVHTLYQ